MKNTASASQLSPSKEETRDEPPGGPKLPGGSAFRTPGTDPTYPERAKLRSKHLNRRKRRSPTPEWEGRTLEELNAILWPSGKPPLVPR